MHAPHTPVCPRPRPPRQAAPSHPLPRPCTLQHILVAPDKKDLIPQLRQRIEAGETLAALAAEHSQCPSRRRAAGPGGQGPGAMQLAGGCGSKHQRRPSPMDPLPPPRSNGGSIGWIGKGQTVPEFEAAAFGTAPGSLAVCTTRFGVHLLQVLGER